MKILLVHYKYSMSGGPERYLFNITSLLEKHGNTVAHFSIRWNDNKPNLLSDLWPEIPESGGDFFYHKNTNLTLLTKLKLLYKGIYNKAIYRSLNKFITREKPDVCYVLKFMGKLTPAIIDACYDNRIPVIHRISDYNLVCLNSILYNNQVCYKCKSSFVNGVIKNCNKSLIKGMSKYFINSYFYLHKYQKKINSYVVPSINTKSIFKKNKRFKGCDFNYLPTYTNIEFELSESILKNRFESNNFIYWGRVSEEKGLVALIDVFRVLNIDNHKYRLTIIGVSNDAFSLWYNNKIKKLIATYHLNDVVKLMPFQKLDTIKKLSINAYAYIFPSLIYDNLPQSVIEALAIGLPVIASDLGSLKELILNNKNGFLFHPDNRDDIYNTIVKIKSLTFDDYKKFADNSQLHIKKNYNENNHYKILKNIFEKNLKNAQNNY